MIRFSLKVALAAGAVYYTVEQGFWKDSSRSVELFQRISSFISPYIHEVSQHVDLPLPAVPSPSQLTWYVPQYWNKGVNATCVFICNVPDHISEYGSQGYEYLKSNPNIQNALSFSSSTTSNET